MLVADVTEGELHKRMVGRTRQEFFYREHLQGEPQPGTALDVDDFPQHRCFENVSFSPLRRNSEDSRPF
jgi:hypothetical protein